MPANEWGAKWIRRSRRLALYLRDGFICVYCGESLQLAEPKVITLDHVDPRALFGSPIHTNDNLVTSCLRCNVAKGDQQLHEWATTPIVMRVESALVAPVPYILANHLLNTATPTKRRSVWLTAFRNAQRRVRIDATHCQVIGEPFPVPRSTKLASRGASIKRPRHTTHYQR